MIIYPNPDDQRPAWMRPDRDRYQLRHSTQDECWRIIDRLTRREVVQYPADDAADAVYMRDLCWLYNTAKVGHECTT